MLSHARSLRHSALATLLVLLLLWPGCSDEVTPPPGDNAVRTLTIIARERDPITNECSINAANVEITVFRVDDKGETPIATLTTGGDGIARYAAELPPSGVNIAVRGLYKNQLQYSVPRILVFCGDATVQLCYDGTPPTDVDCQRRIDTTMVLPIVNEVGSTQLIRNLPLGLGRYQAMKTLFTNTNPYDMCVTVDARSNGAFHLDHMQTTRDVTGEVPARVAPGEQFTALFSVSTADVGSFDQPFVFTVKACGADTCQPKIFRVRVQATVIDLPCDCPANGSYFLIPDGTVHAVGTTTSYPGLVLETFSIDCGSVFVDNVSQIDNNEGWRITRPAAPFPVEITDHRLSIDASFTPVHAGVAEDTFRVEIRFVNGKRCTLDVRLRGEACRDLCPLIGMQGRPMVPFSSTPITHIMNSGAVSFSNLQCSSNISSVRQDFMVHLPDTACCPSPATIQISVIDDDPSRVASRFFAVSPSSSMSVTKGSSGGLTVRFNAPSVTEFDRLFSSGQRVRTGTLVDSMFTIRIQLVNTTCGQCSQFLVVTAIVNMTSQLSPIRNLRAYGQKTDLVRTPSTEVCSIEATTNGNPDPGLVRALIDVNKVYPYPPNDGDFFVEVADTSVDLPPLGLKEPMLFRVNGTPYRNLLRVASGYAEQSILAITPIVNLVESLLQANPNYFTQASLPFSFPASANSIRPIPGEVYAIFGDEMWPGVHGPVPCRIALLYVRSRTVGQGEENANTHHQSGIEFRLVHPVVLY